MRHKQNESLWRASQPSPHSAILRRISSTTLSSGKASRAKMAKGQIENEPLSPFSWEVDTRRPSLFMNPGGPCIIIFLNPMRAYTLDVIGFIVNHRPHPCEANGQQGDLLSHLKGQIAVCGKSALQIRPLAISLGWDPTVAPAITNNYRVNFDLLFPNVFLRSERPSQRFLCEDLFIFHRRIHRSSNPAVLQSIYRNEP